MRQWAAADFGDRKQPETFCLTLAMRMSPSDLLYQINYQITDVEVDPASRTAHSRWAMERILSAEVGPFVTRRIL